MNFRKENEVSSTKPLYVTYSPKCYQLLVYLGPFGFQIFNHSWGWEGSDELTLKLRSTFINREG